MFLLTTVLLALGFFGVRWAFQVAKSNKDRATNVLTAATGCIFILCGIAGVILLVYRP